MRTHAVTGKADNLGVGFLKFGIILAEIDAFGCASRGVVFGVEVDDEILALVIRQFEGLDGCFSGEVRDNLVKLDGFF